MDNYKKTGEKVQIGNRSACIYTKGKGKKKYIKKNKEMILLSKIIKRGGDSPPEEIYRHYKKDTLVLEYIPIEYNYKESDPVYSDTPVVRYIAGKSQQYSNNIEIFENPEDKSVRGDYEPKYCSDVATKKYIEANRLTKELKFSNTKTNVVKWNIPDKSIVLVFGDVHGDIVSLEKTLQRWVSQKHLIPTNEEEPKYTVVDNVYIISTGDLIDYGTNSMNVLCALLRLRADNPGKVMLLCGNHETPDDNISGRDDFTQEIAKKSIDSTAVKFVKENIHLIGPDMLALHFGDELEGTYFMHGMYPAKDVYVNEIDDFETHFWPYHFIDMESLSNLIQWNDVSTDGATRRSTRGNLKKTHLQLGSGTLLDIMEKYRIKGFVRGHQDLCGTQLYPLEFYEKCLTTTSKKTATMENKKCDINQTNDDRWCKVAIEYAFKFMRYGFTETEDSFLKNRVITTSMANEKTRGVSPMGGYIKITAVKVETRRPPPSLEPTPPPPSLKLSPSLEPPPPKNTFFGWF